jgi:hypothetical protein
MGTKKKKSYMARRETIFFSHFRKIGLDPSDSDAQPHRAPPP